MLRRINRRRLLFPRKVLKFPVGLVCINLVINATLYRDLVDSFEVDLGSSVIGGFRVAWQRFEMANIPPF